MFSCEIRECFSLGKIFSKALSAENQLFPEAQSQKAATNIDIKSNQSVSQCSSSIRSALTNAFSCLVHLLCCNHYLNKIHRIFRTNDIMKKINHFSKDFQHQSFNGYENIFA